jgi:hypothetical protein
MLIYSYIAYLVGFCAHALPTTSRSHQEFLNMTQCRLVVTGLSKDVIASVFRLTHVGYLFSCWTALIVNYPEDGGSTLFRNIGKQLAIDTA